jgi:hypothetical protein
MDSPQLTSEVLSHCTEILSLWYELALGILAVAGPAVPASAAAPCSPDMMPPSFG